MRTLISIALFTHAYFTYHFTLRSNLNLLVFFTTEVKFSSLEKYIRPISGLSRFSIMSMVFERQDNDYRAIFVLV